jgi:hypothetical protein
LTLRDKLVIYIFWENEKYGEKMNKNKKLSEVFHKVNKK